MDESGRGKLSGAAGSGLQPEWGSSGRSRAWLPGGPVRE